MSFYLSWLYWNSWWSVVSFCLLLRPKLWNLTIFEISFCCCSFMTSNCKLPQNIHKKQLEAYKMVLSNSFACSGTKSQEASTKKGWMLLQYSLLSTALSIPNIYQPWLSFITLYAWICFRIRQKKKKLMSFTHFFFLI